MQVEILSEIKTRSGVLTPGQVVDLPEAIIENLSGKVRVIKPYEARLEGEKLLVRGLCPQGELAQVIFDLTTGNEKLRIKLLRSHIAAWRDLPAHVTFEWLDAELGSDDDIWLQWRDHPQGALQYAQNLAAITDRPKTGENT